MRPHLQPKQQQQQHSVNGGPIYEFSLGNCSFGRKLQPLVGTFRPSQSGNWLETRARLSSQLASLWGLPLGTVLATIEARRS